MKPASTKALTYGPVPSRRLGYSLGLDILPFKTCSMDCVYCQLGTFGRTTIRRREYVPVRSVLAAVRQVLASGVKIEAITFSGSGEPTLHAGIGRIIAGIKRMTAVPIVVLTNSATLAARANGRDLLQADIVVPSLDAVTDRIFAQVNRPHAGIKAAKIVDGLARFRRRFKGRIWLEVMLVRGINDGPAHLRRLREAIDRIQPDRVQINTVVRPPAEKTARPLTAEALERARRILGPKAEVIADFRRAKQAAAAPDASAALLSALGRRPMTAADLARGLGLPKSAVAALTRRLAAAGLVRPVRHSGSVYFEKASAPD
jgi:wyosine [tRNA(Phe)-imidazoG37] synthetase (radical SAM superfamily)